MAEETATFVMKIDADAEPAAEAAAELEKFRQTIVKSNSALADYRKSQSLLKGSSAEVVDAKAKLKAAIELEKGKVSQAGLGILKLGGSYEKLTKAQKKGKDSTDAAKKAIAAAQEPVKQLGGKFDTLKEMLTSATGKLEGFAVGLGVGVVVAVAAAAAGIVDLTLKFTEWLATTADANRNLQLTREAFSGSAANATAWGHAIDWASEKTALTTAQLNDLVVQTEKTYRGFRISGQGMVDAFKASAAAAGAGRPDVAAFFDEIISRGKLTGRSFVGPQDFARFRAAGLDVKKLYAELRISAGQASRGAVVSTDKMAAALRKLSENRFADINAKKMLALGAQWDRFKGNLMRLTNDLSKGGALVPLLKAIQSVASAFDLSTASGQELKKTITEYGKALANAITTHITEIKAFIMGVIDLGVAFVKAGAAVIEWSQSATGIFVIKTALVALGLVFAAIGIVIVAIGLGFLALAAPIIAAAAAIYGLWEAGKKLLSMDWGSIGKGIIDGIKNGLEAAWDGLKGAVTGIGEGIKSTFKSLLGIASPSRVFMEYGIHTGRGYQQGIARVQPAVNSATAGMAATAAAGVDVSGAVATQPAPRFGVGFAGGGGAVDSSRSVHVGTIENHFHVPAGANAQEVKSALESRGILDGFEARFRLILQSMATPVDQPQVSGG